MQRLDPHGGDGMTVLLKPVAPSSQRPLHSRPWAAPLGIGLLGLVLSLAFSWVPSVWFDEAATVSATMRSWPQLWKMLDHVDAVHGLYYAGMHLWFDVVGYTPFTLRLPSAIATGLAASLIVLLVRQFSSRTTAMLAGLFFCLLPRVTWMGTEGRSYALTALLAVALTLVFLAALRSGASSGRARLAWWLFYAVLAAVSTLTFLYVALLVVAHGVTALWSWRSSRVTTRSLVGWFVASAAAGLSMLPFAGAVVNQSGQVSWIDPISWNTFRGVFVSQFFYKNGLFAAVGWALAAIGLVLLVWRARRRPRLAEPRTPSMLSVVLPWLVIPTVGLVLASLLVAPLYSPRYVTFGAPAVAILMTVAVSALRRRWLIAGVVTLCVALALPQIVAQRMPEAKQESSWSEVAAFVATERALEASEAPQVSDSAEAIIYGPVRRHLAATTRVIEYSYPDAFEGLIDVKLKTPAAETGQLWETHSALEKMTDRLAGVGVVWLVTSDRQDWRPSITQKLGTLGYELDGEWSFTGVNVLRYRL